MKTKIVRVGNSQGIRIPKLLLEQTGLSGEVEIAVEENRLVISPASRARAGWEEAFQEMAEAGDDELVWGDAESLTSWDEAEWEWQ